MFNIKSFTVFAFAMAHLYDAKIYNGKCPKIYDNVKVDCNGTTFSSELKVVGFLSNSPDTLNFFYNEFKSINCVTIEINCKGYQNFLLNFNLKCKSLTDFKHCYPILMHSQTESNEYHLSFDFIKNTQCTDDIIEKDIKFLYNNNFQHVIIYGCYERDNAVSDHGLWILASAEMIQKIKDQEFKEQTAKILDKINPNLINDVLFYDADKQECDCSTCDYFMQCQTSHKLKMIKKSLANETRSGNLTLFILCCQIALIIWM